MRAHTSTAIAIVLLISGFNASAAEAPKQKQQMLSSQNGRYVFGQISEYRRDQFLIDTQTGRVWKIVVKQLYNEDGTVSSEEGYPVLDPVPFNDAKGRAVDAQGNFNLTPK